MYDHIGLKISDIDASVRFYESALGALGLELCSRDQASAGFGPRGEPGLWLQSGELNGGLKVHVALRAKSRGAVERFHAEGLKAGGRDNGKPGLRIEYSPNYYAAFLLDPDGNNIEAVCME
jgi:catechol 2,3-dioxygenase-like lactoylglutathione lyase family enzyme